MSGSARRGACAGYALPTVLAVVGSLALVFAAAASALAAAGASARRAGDRAAFAAAAESAEAEALFLTATRPFEAQALAPSGPRPPAGSSEARASVRLDDRAYAWARDPALRVRMQDEAGLINLDGSRPDTLLRLFARLGLTAVEAEALRDRLLDALDGARTRRPRGATAEDYAAAGRPAPPPGGFADLREAAGVLGWTELMTPPRRRALEAWATAVPGSTAFNVNTASAPVLAAVLNLDDAAARRLVARREAGPVTDLVQLGLPPAGGPGAEPVRPNGRVRLTVEDARRGLRYTSRLLPQDAPGGPPWIAVDATTAGVDGGRAPPDAPLLADPAGP